MIIVVPTWEARDKSPPSLNNFDKIKIFRPATKKYLGKTKFLCTENELLLQEKVPKFRYTINLKVKIFFFRKSYFLVLKIEK